MGAADGRRHRGGVGRAERGVLRGHPTTTGLSFSATADGTGTAFVSGTRYYFKVVPVTETITSSPNYVLDMGTPSNEVSVVCP